MSTTVAQLSVNVTADTANAEKGLKSVSDKTETTGSKLKDFLGKALPIAGAFAGVNLAGDAMGFLKDQITDAFNQAEAAQLIASKLNTELRATHDASGMTAGGLNDLADSLSQVTTYDDDAVRSAEGVLLQFTNIGKQTFPAATKATADLATGLGTDLPSAAEILGRALDNPLQASRSLREAHITLTTAQSNLIKHFQAVGDKADAQKVILDAVKDRFGGLAKAAGETTAGKLQIFQNRLDDAKKGLATAFLPALAGAATVAVDLVDKVNGLIGKLGDFAGFLQSHQQLFDVIKAALVGIGIALLGSLIPAAIASVPAFLAWATAAGAAALATLAAAAPVIGIGLAIGALILGIKALIDHWGQVSQFFGNLFSTITGFFGNVLGAIGTFFGNILGGLGTFAGNFLSGIGTFAGNVLGAIAGFVGNVIGAYLGLYKRILEALATFVGNFIKAIGSFVGNVIKTVAGFVGNVIGAYLGLYRRILGIIASLVGDVLGKIGGFVGSFLGKVGDLKDKVVRKIQDLATGFLSALASLPGKLLNLGLQLMQNFAQGIKNGAGAVVQAVKNVPVLGGAVSGAGDALGFIGSHLPGHAAGGPASGLFIGAEQGPELLLKPGVYAAPPGSYVLNAHDTRAALSGVGANGTSAQPRGPAIGEVHIHGADANQVLSLLARETMILRMQGRI